MKDFKSTPESQRTFLGHNSYVVKLERYMKDLLQFDCLLNSYMCEPQTKELFEQKFILKLQMKSAKNANRDIIDAICANDLPTDAQINRMKLQMKLLERLESDLKAYSSEVLGHSKLVS